MRHTRRNFIRARDIKWRYCKRCWLRLVWSLPNTWEPTRSRALCEPCVIFRFLEKQP
jgi:hypothetical protein